MFMPKQSQPVVRAAGTTQAAQARGCAGIPNNIVGTCNFPNGPVQGFNCAACCAQRQALSWQGGGFAVAC